MPPDKNNEVFCGTIPEISYQDYCQSILIYSGKSTSISSFTSQIFGKAGISSVRYL